MKIACEDKYDVWIALKYKHNEYRPLSYYVTFK